MTDDSNIIREAREDIESCINNYALTVTFAPAEPLDEDTEAITATVWHQNYAFEIHVQVRDVKNTSLRAAYIHVYDEVWDYLCDEAIWRNLFWKALKQVKK